MKEIGKELVKDILIALIIVLVLTTFIKPTIVKEQSMVPTLEPNDYLIMSKQAFTLGNMERGDIIIFESNLYTPSGDKKLLIKRAIAIAGDKISITGGRVFVNDTQLDEPYVNVDYTPGDIDNLLVPEGKVFAMGDNREVSLDSRSDEVGLVDMKDVKGEAIFRLWPFKEFGTIK